MYKKYSQQKVGKEARDLLLKGFENVYDVVCPTLGARGKNIILHKVFQTRSINDGVKTAQRVNSKDPFVRAGEDIIKQAGQQQMDKVGDGTTAALILGYAIAKEAEKLVSSGVNPMALRTALEKGRDILIKEIRKLAKPIKTKGEKIAVATISSQSEEIGKLIGETLDKTGVDGSVVVEEAVGPETFIEHQEGVQIDAGYKTEYFVTNPANLTATISNPAVLVTDHNLSNVHELIPLFNDIFNPQNPNRVSSLFIIADDITGNVLSTLVQNKIKGTFLTIAIKVPRYQMEQTLKDLAIVTDAEFVNKETYPDLKKITAEVLGKAEKITSSKEATIIINGRGSKEAIASRISAIKQELEEEKSEFVRVKLKERLARLTGGVYVINVGGETEVEIDDKKERIDDAVQATKAAIRGGIIPGGEIIYLTIRKALYPSSDEATEYAHRILYNALGLPFTKLIENAGYNAGQMMEIIKQHNSPNIGIDVIIGEPVNVIAKEIIDPAEVAEYAIRNAVSVAVAIITSDGIIVEVDEDEKGR